jgi:membrane protein
VTAAATLSIINGILGILRVAATLIFIAPFFRPADNWQSFIHIYLLACIEVGCPLAIAVTMLRGGLQLRKGGRRDSLLVAGFIQITMVLLESAFLIPLAMGPASLYALPFPLMQSIGLVLPTLIVIFLLRKNRAPQHTTAADTAPQAADSDQPPRPELAPTRVTAAAALGITTGFLGIIRGTVMLSMAISSFVDAGFREYGRPHLLVLGIDTICTLGIAVIMLRGGLRLRKSGKRTALLVASFIQAPVVILESVLLLIIYSPSYASLLYAFPFPFMQFVGLALPVLIFLLLRKKTAPQHTALEHTTSQTSEDTTPQRAINDQPSRPDPAPAKVTTAATLGITIGILAIIRILVPNISIAWFIERFDRLTLDYTFDSSGNRIPGKDYSTLIAWLHGLNYGEKILTCGIAVAMLFYSIWLLKKKNRTVLLIAGATQSVLAVLEIGFIVFMYSYLIAEWDFSMDTEFTDTFLMIMPLLALLILSILLIVFLRSRDVTTWCRPPGRDPHTWTSRPAARIRLG